MGGIAGGVAGWIKNAKSAQVGGPKIDPWGFKSAGKGRNVVEFGELKLSRQQDGFDLNYANPSKNRPPIEGLEYLDEGVRSTPQPFAGGAIYNVQFGKDANQISHAFRHIDDLGLNRIAVQSAIRQDISSIVSKIIPGRPFNKIIQIAGQRIQYTAFKLPNGTINIGRIHGTP